MTKLKKLSLSEKANLKLLLEREKCVIGLNQLERYKKITKGFKIKYRRKTIECNNKKEDVIYITI